VADDEKLDQNILHEAVFGALGAALANLLPKAGGEQQLSLDVLNRLTHAQLATLKGPSTHDRGIEFALRHPGEQTKMQGVMAWDSELLQLDLAAEREGRQLHPADGWPRLFLSHRWGTDVPPLQRIEFLAGSLFNRGYDIVYDRDPRHIEKGFTASDLLLLLPGCTHFVALLTDEYTLRISDQTDHSPARQEWAWAAQLSKLRQRPQFMGIWLAGERLPRPFTAKNVLDCRQSDTASGMIQRNFPICQFAVVGCRRDGTGRTIGPLERRLVNAALKEFEPEGDEFVSLTVHDVTRRPWAHGLLPIQGRGHSAKL